MKILGIFDIVSIDLCLRKGIRGKGVVEIKWGFEQCLKTAMLVLKRGIPNQLN